MTRYLLYAFGIHRTSSGLLSSTTWDDKTPLFPSSGKSPPRAIEGSVSIAVKRMLKIAAQLAEGQGNLEAALSLKEVYTHWLRHSIFTNLAKPDKAPVTLR